MSQVLHGVASVVRVVRSPLGIVALTLFLLVSFSAVIFLFAPLSKIEKYIIGGFPWILAIGVYYLFWRARNEPLSVSEDWWIEALRHQHIGTPERPLTFEQLSSLTPQENPEHLRLSEPIEDESGEEECST